MNKESYVGIISCSGEDCLGGTISRLATRKILESMDEAVTICLPLYIAGGEEERSFAKEYPTVTVDGCCKYCAKKATEKYSGKVSDAINVADIIGKTDAESCALSTKSLSEAHFDMVEKTAAAIKEKINTIL